MPQEIIKAKDFRGFLRYLTSNDSNHILIILSVILTSLLWLVFKCAYSIPYFSYDSYDYLNAAFANIEPNYHPNGYSKFLDWMQHLAHSKYLLVTVQYCMIQGSLLLLLLSLKYFWRLGIISTSVLFVFFFINPLFIDASNHIMSDVTFTSLTIIFFVLIIWIVYDPKPIMVVFLALIIGITFSLRYNALCFPLIAMLVLLISQIGWPWKIIGIILQLIFIGFLVLNTSKRIESITGVYQFSPFSSWKIANNALYMYAKVKPIEHKQVPPQFVKLDSLVVDYFNKNIDNYTLYDKDYTHGCYYVFSPRSPLTRYSFGDTHPVPIFTYNKFALSAPLYKSYGEYLIKQHPIEFARYVVWPSILRFIVPHGELFDSIDIKFMVPKNDNDGRLAHAWFGFDDDQIYISTWFHSFRNAVLKYTSFSFAIINIFFIISVVLFFIYRRKLRSIKSDFSLEGLFIIFWMVNLLFTSITGPSVVRFELFVVILEFSFSVYCIEILCLLYKRRRYKRGYMTSGI